MGIKLDVQKTGIPIDFGEVELLFDTSEENVIRLYEIKDGKSKELKELEEQRKQLKINKDDINKEQFEEVVINAKSALRVLYDTIFGEGSFDKVYEVYPSIKTLSEGFLQIMDQLPGEIQEQNKRFEKKQNDKIKKYRSKK